VRWIKQQAHATVVFDDASPFVNTNTSQELDALAGRPCTGVEPALNPY